MTNNLDVEFIKNCLEKWYDNCPEILLKSESKELLGYTMEDSGVPKEIEVGEPDEDCYVKWKLIPSNIS
ncbi:hypothetical protein QA584_14685 [Anaerocolumna sp. AGMB13025]|uniref:hypothetical protein n=1 Tax=Anaerocolumna sp. AGMB13025 TaxID=3039116 RepID=UPI00241FBC64|nr:hypothetical protein [Anaerocolumna sp. AGMB13025]WFR54864.1 hypothetical protein QA584_14685 [Anaerocolumna sp. AGMB13025]